MITRTRLTDFNDKVFQECWGLYCEAFPTEERRKDDYQIDTLKYKEYIFDALYDDDSLIGFIAWWAFDDYNYIEHFAIFSNMRNGGYGKKVLNAFLQESLAPVILEVEHPTEEINKRRIGFYQTLGFILNEWDYQHLPYAGTELVSLMIMTYPKGISNDELNEFKNKYFKLIHFRHF